MGFGNGERSGKVKGNSSMGFLSLVFPAEGWGGAVAMQALLQGTPTPFGSKSRIARVWVAAADRLEGMRGWGRESVKTSELSTLMQSMLRSSEATCVNITRIYASIGHPKLHV